jgi:hypothetical protein
VSKSEESHNKAQNPFQAAQTRCSVDPNATGTKVGMNAHHRSKHTNAPAGRSKGRGGSYKSGEDKNLLHHCSKRNRKWRCFGSASAWLRTAASDPTTPPCSFFVVHQRTKALHVRKRPQSTTARTPNAEMVQS